jgi:hypothetical protein
MIISLGVDCGIADFCNRHKIRFTSLPFDWTVAYNGVSDCIADEFTEFLNITPERVNKYDIYFHHHFENDTVFEEHATKYKRRIHRFLELLKTPSEFLVFCRRGHASHHHLEHGGKYKSMKSDIQDAEGLDVVLRTKYPELKYKIVVMVVCGECFDCNAVYKSSSERIEIHNIATPYADDPAFEQLAKKLLLK